MARKGRRLWNKETQEEAKIKEEVKEIEDEIIEEDIDEDSCTVQKPKVNRNFTRIRSYRPSDNIDSEIKEDNKDEEKEEVDNDDKYAIGDVDPKPK